MQVGPAPLRTAEPLNTCEGHSCASEASLMHHAVEEEGEGHGHAVPVWQGDTTLTVLSLLCVSVQ